MMVEITIMLLIAVGLPTMLYFMFEWGAKIGRREGYLRGYNDGASHMRSILDGEGNHIVGFSEVHHG